MTKRPVGGKVMVQRARREAAELAAHGGDRTGPVGHAALRVAQLLDSHDARPPALAPACPGSLHALENALAQEVTLHLCKGGLDLQKRPARGDPDKPGEFAAVGTGGTNVTWRLGTDPQDQTTSASCRRF